MLTVQMDAFRMGYLWQFALTMDAMCRRDLVLLSAKSKREKAVSQHGWDIVKMEESPQATKHAAALKFFYDHLTATDALDQDDCGGVALLLEQMMRSVLFRFNVHEMVWQPKVGAITYETQPATSTIDPVTGAVKESPAKSATMDGITATFRAVPLWFFENITGKLRYLKQFGELYGRPMEEGGWLTTGGVGMGEGVAVSYCYKHLLALKDWASLMERWGDTKAYGKTTAGIGTPEWNMMGEAVRNIASPDSTVVIKADPNDLTEIKTLESHVVSGGESVFERMIDKQDRYMTVALRGGDLSTISHHGGGQGQGASVQGEESEILESQDCRLISETLNSKVDKFVIWYLFEEEPAAYFKVAPPEEKAIDTDLKVDLALAAGGAQQKVGELAERYSRSVTNPDDVFKAPAQPLQSPEQEEGKEDDDPGAKPSASNAKKDLPRSVKAIVQNPDGHVLLLKDARSDYWDLPGGHVQQGESDEHALAREVLEETGMNIGQVLPMRTMNLNLGDEATQVLFFGTQYDGDDDPKLSEEHTAAKYVPVDELGDYDTGAFTPALVGLRNAGSMTPEQKKFAKAVDEDVLAPLRAKYGPLLERLSKALDMADEPMQAELFRMRPDLEAMQRDLPKLLQKNPKAAQVLEEMISQAFMEGATYQVKHVKPEASTIV